MWFLAKCLIEDVSEFQYQRIKQKTIFIGEKIDTKWQNLTVSVNSSAIEKPLIINY
mgnify:CR=1 FL=1